MTANGKTLREKALLVKFSTTQWIGERFDKKITQEIEEAHHTNNAGRFNKSLVTKEALLKSKQARNTARTFVYTQTLPWSDEGWRMLPSLNYLPFTQELRKITQEIETADQTFLGRYDDYKNEAQARMNSLYNPKDYPTIDRLKDKFSTSIEYRPIPDSTDFRVDLDPEEIETIGADLDTRVKEATEAATKDLWERLYNAVNHMEEKLNDPKAIFRDSLVTNLKDLTDLLTRLNITNDPDLERMRKEIEARLTQVNPEDLRPKDTDRPVDKAAKANNRKQTAQEAKEILESMEAYFTPCRKE